MKTPEEEQAARLAKYAPAKLDEYMKKNGHENAVCDHLREGSRGLFVSTFQVSGDGMACTICGKLDESSNVKMIKRKDLE